MRYPLGSHFPTKEVKHMAGYLRRAVRLGGLVIVATVAAIGCAVAGFAFVIIRQAARELPTPVALREERLVADTIVVDRDGRRIAALRRGDMHREVVPYEAMNPVIRDAVVASEDERFWTHHGMDPYGVARAFVRNVTNGRRLQGGSTITQQLLKLTMLQGRPPLLRKVEEAMLAQRFERLLTKEQLLSLYLNAVYLGGGNAGVEAASRDLFGIPSSQVSLSQAALLVGAIPAPSNRSPLCEPETARQQQRRVLRRMVEARLLAASVADRVAAEPIRFRLAGDGLSDADVASVLDLVAIQRVQSAVLNTSIDLPLQQRALVALRATLDGYARARGEHRGPRFLLNAAVRERWLADLHTFRETLREWGTGVREFLVYDLRQVAPSATPSSPCRYGSAMFRSAVPHGFASGVVVSVDAEIATLDLGDLRGTISAASIAWTGKPLQAVTPVGAIVDVRLPDALPRERGLLPKGSGPEGATVMVDLIPRPVVEGAVVVLDPRTREILALVGGTEPRRGSYNRALRARRPIGSTVKPLVFAAAIGAGALDLEAELHDVAYRYVNPETRATWEPENWYDEHLGPLSVADAIARSVNMAAIEAAFTVGVDRVTNFIEEVSPVAAVRPDPSIALGALTRTPLELANAFATFADHGRVAPVRFLASVSPPLAEVESEGVRSGTTVLDPQLTRVMDQLLTAPITHPHGTARRLAKLNLGIRGKTGTTDGARDAWFVGYTPSLLVAVWIGYDQPQRLKTPRREESGGTLAVPVAEAIFAQHADRREVKP